MKSDGDFDIFGIRIEGEFVQNVLLRGKFQYIYMYNIARSWAIS